MEEPGMRDEEECEDRSVGIESVVMVEYGRNCSPDVEEDGAIEGYVLGGAEDGGWACRLEPVLAPRPCSSGSPAPYRPPPIMIGECVTNSGILGAGGLVGSSSCDEVYTS
jgi:hypothetical protein